MGWRLIRAVGGGLEVGQYDAVTLRRWFRRLDEIVEESAYDFDLCRAAFGLRISVMDVMSVNLPAQPIYLSRIEPFEMEGLDGTHVEKLRRAGSYGDPIVVLGNLVGGPLELADGRHRVTSARLNGFKDLACCKGRFAIATMSKKELSSATVAICWDVRCSFAVPAPPPLSARRPPWGTPHVAILDQEICGPTVMQIRVGGLFHCPK